LNRSAGQFIHGRGIFASQRFEKGQTIEKAPLIFLTAQEREWLQTTSLFQYYFLVGDAATPAAIGLA
jgi:uncharacterized protein